jgi:6-phosphogluconolactonase
MTPRVSSGEGPTSITVDSQGRFAYVTNAIAGSVSVFAIDVANGALTPRSTVSAGTNPVALTLDGSGRFAYVANLGSDNVTHFAVDSNTGALTAVGLPFSAGTGPASLTLVK